MLKIIGIIGLIISCGMFGISRFTNIKIRIELLEEYYEIFYSDESSNKEKEQAAIEAGKLLVFQILENTEDRTGLIESCKKGGTITLKTTTDDLIEEVLEWMPTMVIVEEKEVVAHIASHVLSLSQVGIFQPLIRIL